jgi:hypothetical protein
MLDPAAAVADFVIVFLCRRSCELDNDIHRIIATSCDVRGDFLIARSGWQRQPQNQSQQKGLFHALRSGGQELAIFFHMCSEALFLLLFSSHR